MRVSLLIPLIAGACIVAAPFRDTHAGIIRHDRDAAKYRALGENKAFESVGEVTFDRPARGDNGWRPSACAVLIAPQWVLTAGHVGNKPPMESQCYTFNGEVYRAVRVVSRPGFDPKGRGDAAALAAISAGADLALVRLDRPVEGVKLAVRYRGKDEVGRTMTQISYGVAGDGKSGIKLPLKNERWGGNNVIDAAGGKFKDLTVTDRVLIYDFDDPDDATLNQLGDAKPVELEIGLSMGDSGGGWFIEVDGEWQLVAIQSGGLPNEGEPRTTNNPRYGSLAAGVRVSTANDWIDAVLAEPEPDAK